MEDAILNMEIGLTRCIMETNDYDLLNKVVLFIAQDYIVRTKNDSGAVPPVLHRLEAAITVYKRGNMFTQEEAKLILKVAQSDEISAIMDREVSFIIFTFELMKLWTTYVHKEYRPILNISDKNFRLGGRQMWRQMLYLKQRNAEEHEVKQQIIDDSIDVATEFFNYHTQILIKENT